MEKSHYSRRKVVSRPYKIVVTSDEGKIITRRYTERENAVAFVIGALFSVGAVEISVQDLQHDRGATLRQDRTLEMDRVTICRILRNDVLGELLQVPVQVWRTN